MAARLAGLRVTAPEGPAAARFFYDEDHVRRDGAVPEPVQGTLSGKGAVPTLDGEAHRVRKGLVVALLMRVDGIASLVDGATAAWDEVVEAWAARDRIVLFEESADVIAGASPGRPRLTGRCRTGMATCGTPSRHRAFLPSERTDRRRGSRR